MKLIVEKVGSGQQEINQLVVAKLVSAIWISLKILRLLTIGV